MNTDMLCQLKDLWQAAFHEPPEAIDNFFATGFSPHRFAYLEENNKILCALYWFDCSYPGGKLAYIYAVATDPAHRGKGLASRLLEQTHARLKTQGYAGAVLKPANGLFPFYQRLGYVTSGYLRRFHAEAANSAALKVLTAADYGRQRRHFLPENAIVQEGAALDFLESFASFYAAEDALVCVSREDSVIFEYLGNPLSAPGILAALGIKSAQIPTPGTEIPFAMWLPLNCTKPPGYLGLSLE